MNENIQKFMTEMVQSGNVLQAAKTDGYKLGHISQYVKGTEQVYSTFTARKDKLARVMEENGTRKMVLFGIQSAIKQLYNNWQTSFFDQPKDTVIEYYKRRVKNYLGPDNGDEQIAAMAALHDLGYLPLRIKALPEGSRVDEGTPFLTLTNTHPEFYWLTNYGETYLSCMIWASCNSASISEQYYLTSKRWAEKTADVAAMQQWLPIANHDFSARGMRFDQDAMMSGMAHLLFGIGSDTLWSIDGLEMYYNADSDKEPVAVSVNAFEHATATQRIAYFGSEAESVRDVLTNVYPKGILSYVADSKDYYHVITKIAEELKDVIISRQPDSLGLPGKLVFRPDSSPKTPLEVICGERYVACDPTDVDFDSVDAYLLTGYYEGSVPEASVLEVDGRYYYPSLNYHVKENGDIEDAYVDGILKEVSEEEVKGTLQILWEIFGGTINERGYKVLHPSVGVIYGEAITMELQEAIYKRMEEMGFCVTNVVFGVGSWSKLDRSSRDSYSLALKGGYSVVDGEGFSMNKTPKTDMSKASREGLLRVEEENGKFVTYDNQTPEQEQQGELQVVFEDGTLYNETSLSEIRSRLGWTS